MSGSKPNHKPASKPARQLLFSEALHHKRPTPATTGPHASPHLSEPTMMADKEHSTTMELILLEITTVSRRIEGMDASLTSLTLETKSMRSVIAGDGTGTTHVITGSTGYSVPGLRPRPPLPQEQANGYGGPKMER
ncbi:hypothetical protein NDU88_006431 [Pleurodeles waltl]|uniref:Uncharacterized protein n=1 Tax=Pleurodeles waltl TaxID=8319 RepID=A0AAV7UMG2_PLEWA|nr:hypothetical protein NDU88_006431 [Pleurodeles waltl]